MQAYFVIVSHPSFLAISSLSAFFSLHFLMHLVIFHTYFIAVLVTSSLIYRDRKNLLYPIYASLDFRLPIHHLITLPVKFVKFC